MGLFYTLLLGMIQPSDPDLTKDDLDSWIRYYVEVKWRLQGKDTSRIPDHVMELAQLEHEIMTIVRIIYSDHFGYGLDQWDKDAYSHWRSPYPEWFLVYCMSWPSASVTKINLKRKY